VCDDVPFNHLAINNLLKKIGMNCDNAYNGFEAINMVINKLSSICRCPKIYKLIIMDIEMPIKDGF
jgi:CheY-like chemotaxis protein